MFRLVVHGSVRPRLRARGGCERRREVRAAARRAPPARGRALRRRTRRADADRPSRLQRRPQALHAESPAIRVAAVRAYRLPWPIEVGTVRAGDWASSVPDTLVAEGRYGVAVGEDVAAARRAFEEAIARAAAADPWLAAHPPAVEWWGGRFDPAVTEPSTTPSSRPSPPPRPTSPARRLRSRASPTAPTCVCSSTSGASPRCCSARATSASPTCPTSTFRIADLSVAAKTLILTALRFCGVVGIVPGGRVPNDPRSLMPLPTGYILRHPEPRHEAPAIQAVLDAAESADTGEPRRHENGRGQRVERPASATPRKTGGWPSLRTRLSRGGLGVAGDGDRGHRRPLRASRPPRPRARGVMLDAIEARAARAAARTAGRRRA